GGGGRIMLKNLNQRGYMFNFLKNVFIIFCIIVIWEAINNKSGSKEGYSQTGFNSCDRLVRLTTEKLKQENNELRRTYILMKLEAGLQMSDELKKQFCLSALEHPDDFFNVKK
ncbi:hypothetical protein, partial [uncultured Campylobacter sp.]|uniref:hypothetical protein n=2 Tax=uncultured Campylobacter sp. TaxID=218934 RepID=UPI00262B4AFA